MAGESVPRLWVVVSCMGRLAHLRLTAPGIIAQERVGYCLSDFSCPDASGTWLEREFSDQVSAGRVCSVRCPGETLFHKTRALNRGARRALDAGAELLCFSDADTLLLPESFGAMCRLLAPGRFLIAGRGRDGRSVRSLTGLLAVTAGDFRRSGGYDEEFKGWGSEDIAMRLKLHLCHGLEALELPTGLVRPIPHSNYLRTRYAEERDLVRNARRNEALLRTYVERWTGRAYDQLPASARALVFS